MYTVETAIHKMKGRNMETFIKSLLGSLSEEQIANLIKSNAELIASLIVKALNQTK